MLTPEQKRAIAFRDGNLQVIACAGSGKTETITRRIAGLVAGGVDPRSIVAFTFTDRAAAEMADRLRLHLQTLVPGEPDLAGLSVGTIHAYCDQRLKEVLPRYRSFDLLDDDMRPLFCSRYYHDFGFEDLLVHYQDRRREPSRYEIIHDFCRNADLVRDERIDPAGLGLPFCECYRAYLDHLQADHYIDFTGMIAHYVEALEEDPALLARERGRVRYLIVDEYQDINTLQEELIRLMVGSTGNLSVVGDDDQCIYHWRGSNYENIISFGTRYPDVTTVRIQQNFRSTPGIISAASRVIDRNELRLPKMMEPWPEGLGQTEEGDIATCFFDDEEEEVAGIVGQIQALLGREYINNQGEERTLSYRDMAVLMRSVRVYARSLISALERAGIPFVVRGGRLFERPEVVIVMQALAFLGEYPYPLRSPVPVHLPLLEEAYLALGYGEAADCALFLKLMTDLKREIDRSESFSLQTLFHRVVQAMGGDRTPFPEVWYYNLGNLSQLVSAFEHQYPLITTMEIHRFLEYIQEHAMKQAEEGGAGEELLPDAVTVTTLHKAKGLQFPVVFIPRLNTGEFPSDRPDRAVWFVPSPLFDRDRYTTSLEDERRLFYVGITRSEKYLFLSGHRQRSGDLPPAEPSTFFSEYPRDHVVDRFPCPAKGGETSHTATPISDRSPARIETSWSALRYYAHCPFDYKLRHLYGFDPMPREELGFGRAVHSVLAAVHTQIVRGTFDPAEIPDLVDEHLLLRFAPAGTTERVQGIVARQTLRYVEQNSHDFARIAGIELPFSFAVGNGVVNGAMDLMLGDGDGGVELRDFKLTEEGEASFRPDVERQLQVYALAARSLGHEVHKATIYHFDTGSITEVAVGPAALAEAQTAVERMIVGIQNQEFPRRPAADRCANCDWHCLCDETEACAAELHTVKTDDC
ncbi:ATP-dependent DNA helicase [Methanosphaerula palustris]|uniref:DNA 3'-5' helicase n=1 Tax=Methanosphaerula palustris (strain ATCC BAA-1556 / DSM 19958 / E1-9c) TaxID=521011 RepID=B8GJD7_METPE|nr:ATP-dependent DNA helicase [Methanosphaerula palustris]ACL16978.1 UvrD/REP helicase [Methanosphaerula palustris E1-9c]